MSRPAATVWLTGLPCAGKTTIATALVGRLRAVGERAELLDGDEVRQSLCAGLGFDRTGRDANVARVGWVAELLSRNGIWAVCALVSPYAAARDAVRAAHGGRFVEAWVSAPAGVCAQRDVKGLYAAQRAGDLANLTGVDGTYEVPVKPDVVLASAERSLEACVEELWQYLGLTLSWLSPALPRQ